MYFEYQNRYFIFFFFYFFFCYSDSDIFSVIMLKNVVRNAARSQIACSQCYNSLFTFTQRKYVFTLNIKIQIVFCFSSSENDIVSSYHAQISSLACCPISNIVFSMP